MGDVEIDYKEGEMTAGMDKCVLALAYLGQYGCSTYLDHRAAGTEEVYYRNEYPTADLCNARCESLSWCKNAFFGREGSNRAGDCGLYGACTLKANSQWDAYGLKLTA